MAEDGVTPPSPRRRWLPIGAAVLVALGIFVLVWFQPQKLVIEEKVDEALPTTTALPADEETAQASRTAPEVLSTGTFSSLEHETEGIVKVIRLSDGGQFVRIEDLVTSNGPDLRVYLSEIPASDDWHAYGERFIDLGALKGNIGNQNYAIPSDVDLDRYRSVVVWCRRFTVGFGVAGLAPSD